jgi:hypothetical protein
MAAIVLALSLGAIPGVMHADGWSDGDAAEATAGQLDDHEASSKNPDDMTAKSRNPDDMVAGSENPDDMTAEAKNPASMVTDAQQLDQHEATSTNLGALQRARSDPGFESIEVPGQSDWQPTTDPEVLVARKHLVQAQQRAAAARTAYGDARRRNYPRGEARIRIVNERDASMKALEEAKRSLAAAESQ